ncbi:MAG: EamA family transporter [Acidobacteriota bacterium]|nr:EamA family transporter [Bryobacteraceae bacterium CoA2 C42]MCA2964592.1 EamA family transporter [Acidobacteriaceae bacterium]
MSNSRLARKTRWFAAIVVATNVLGNFALSWGMKHGAAFDGSPLSFVLVVFNPWVLVGIGLLAGWVLSRMALLSWADLSYVIPVTSIGFVLNAIMGALFLQETISPLRWLGTFCIVGGTVLVGLTAPKTEP